MEIHLNCRLVSSSRSQSYPEDVGVLGKCCLGSHDSSLNVCLCHVFFVSGSVPGRSSFQLSICVVLTGPYVGLFYQSKIPKCL